MPGARMPRSVSRILERIDERSCEAVFVVSVRTSRIVACNTGAERLFGWTTQDLVGRSTETLHPDARSFERFCACVTQTCGSQGVAVSRRALRRRDGSRFQGRDRVISIDSAEQPGLVMWLVRAATAPTVPARGELIERDLLRIAVSHRRPADRWRAVLEHFARELDWSHAEAWLPRSGRMALTAWWSLERAPAMRRFTEVSQSIDFGPGEGLPGRVWRSGNLEWLNDISQKPERVFRRTFIARAAGLRSWFAVPVHNRGVTSHVVLFAGSTPRAIDDDVVTLARQACQAIATVAPSKSPA